MEVWDLYNENRELTERKHIRGKKIPNGYYHLVVHVWIRNSKGEYLISQRSKDRPTFPLMWECVGGSALSGEDSLAAALRETKEEVGIELSANDGKIVYSITGRVTNGVKHADILDVWLFEYNGKANLNDATTAEVKQTRWMNIQEIKALYDDNKLVNTLSYFFSKIHK